MLNLILNISKLIFFIHKDLFCPLKEFADLSSDILEVLHPFLPWIFLEVVTHQSLTHDFLSQFYNLFFILISLHVINMKITFSESLLSSFRIQTN